MKELESGNEKEIGLLKTQIASENNEQEYFYFKSLNVDQYKEALCDWFYRKTGEELNLDDPHTYNEKIQWLKLYDSTQEKADLADKLKVREYVKKKVGEKYLINLLGSWDDPGDIPFEELPDRFVLKANHGCGYNIIVKDKSLLNIDEAVAQLKQWLETDFSFCAGFELHYGLIKRKIIAEEYIENIDGDIYDYKVFCFGGKAKYIMVLHDRKKKLKMVFYDLDWNRMPFTYTYEPLEYDVPKPQNLNELINVAEDLSEGFTHVRVDLYILNDGSIKFGEMTFTTCSGVCQWNPPEYNRYFGDLLVLNSISHKQGRIFMDNISKYFSIDDRKNNKFVKYLYSRGFLISKEPLTVNKEWISYNFYENFYITYDPRVNVQFVKNEFNFVLILGTVMDTVDWHMNIKIIAEKCLSALSSKKELFFDYLDTLSGRHIIFYGDKDNQYLVQDATGMRSCFYAKKKYLVASHYGIINDIIHDEHNPFMEIYLNLPKRPWLLPGATTPFYNIMALTPNHELHLNDMSLKRFWPRKPHDDISAEDATDYIADCIHNQVIVLSRYYKLMFQTTRGNDSRIGLAASKPVKDISLYYSYYHVCDSSQLADAESSHNLANYLGINHIVLNNTDKTHSDKEYQALYDVLRYSHYHRHVWEGVFNYFDHLPTGRLNIRSNLTEIIRHSSRYRMIRNEEYEEIIKYLCSYYNVSSDHYNLLKSIIEEYYNDNEYNKLFDYHFNDIYYWEYFHALWMNAAVLTKDDWNFDTYMLFNNRKILEYGLSMPRYYKDNNLVVFKTIEKLWPEILEPLPNTNYMFKDYFIYNDLHKCEIKNNCILESNLPEKDRFVRIGRYNAALGFGKNYVKKDTFIELLIELHAKKEVNYWIQVDVCANWADNNLLDTNKNVKYEISIDNTKIYSIFLNSFMNKTNQINVLKCFDTGEKHFLKIKLFVAEDVFSDTSSAGVIYIEGIKLAPSSTLASHNTTVVKSTADFAQYFKNNFNA